MPFGGVNISMGRVCYGSEIGSLRNAVLDRGPLIAGFIQVASDNIKQHFTNIKLDGVAPLVAYPPRAKFPKRQNSPIFNP